LQVHTELDALRDLLIYLVDSVPAASLSGVYHALAHETSTVQVQELLARHPSFSSALPRPSTAFRATALVGSQVVLEGESIALDDRPWEMLEQMAPQSMPKHADLFLNSKPLRDSASIPIALFKPQLMRDAVPVEPPNKTPPWEHASSERSLGNGFAGEPIAARQEASLLYARAEHRPKDAELDQDSDTKSSNGDKDSVMATSVKAASSVGSVPPTPVKAQARRFSTRVPTKGSGTTTDPIAIVSDSDDEDEQPLAKRPRTTKAASSTRASTSGKAPRKTSGTSTASTSTGKKAPAKTARAVSGKEKGRRKS
jgi:mediator of RNA polymerase II transcription subunit 12